ncbi:SagB/ThcOx family dehydrogenase [bacterium]|nr:SagB/ThcOx family dehydrogenase [bacterium]
MKESDKIISLPAPSLKGEVSLEETLNLRRSVRSFSQDSLTLEQVSQVLWAGQGITGSSGKRTAPSAGALYPMELYIIVERVSDLKPGCYHYNPHKHQLELAGAGARLNKLAEAALGQSAIKDCAMAVLITAVFERTSVKYGERAERYVWIEAGHIAQNILLQAAALNLGAVPMGAFYDDRVKKTLKLKEEPLYIIPVGGKE